jgi:hypothetical protein
VVREGNFTRAGVGSTAQESGIGNGMVWGAEGTGVEKAFFRIQHAGDGMDLGGFDRIFLRHFRHDGGDALGEHGFPGSRWADHQQVVSAGRGDFQGAFDMMLAFDFLKIDVVSALGFKKCAAIEFEGQDAFGPADEIPCLPKIADGNDADATDHRGLGGVRFRNDQKFTPAGPGFEGDGQHAFDGTHRTIEPELADHAKIIGQRFLPFACTDHCESDREIKGWSFFFQIRRCEVDRFDTRSECQCRGLDGGGDPL